MPTTTEIERSDFAIFGALDNAANNHNNTPAVARRTPRNVSGPASRVP